MRVRKVVLASLTVLVFATVAKADPPVVRSVELRGEGERAEMRIEGVFEVPTYDVRARDGGRTVVVDVEGATLPDSGLRGEGSTSLVAGTTASTTARGVRIEVQLTRPVAYRARAARGRITVSFAEPEHLRREPASADGDVTIQDVHIERRDGRDRVVVELDGATAFRVGRGGDDDGPATLEIRGAGVGSGVDRTLRGESDGAVRRVRVRERRGRVVIEVERARGATGTAIREGDRIVWMFSQAADGRPRSRTIAREQTVVGDGEMDTAEAAAFLTDVPMQVSASRGRRRYSGRRIDLDFKDADIHNILRLIAEVGGVNVVTSDDVGGTVTIRMRNVPWDQALDVILQAKGSRLSRRSGRRPSHARSSGSSSLPSRHG